MLHRPFIKRQLTRSGKQAVVFVLCVALSILTIIALRGFSSSVNEALLEDARALHGGDIIIHSHHEIPRALSDAVAALEERRAAQSTRTYEFYTVVRAFKEDDSLLASLKIVEPGYPLYGNVALRSGRPLGEVLEQGSIAVEQSLLDRLAIQVGESLHIGSTTLTIKDVVVHESDRPVSFFAFGPRVFVSSKDLEALDLIKKGSRIQHIILLKAYNTSDIDKIARELRTYAMEGRERVDTFRTAESRAKKFFDNFLFFLGLIGIFTLLLAGIGIQSALQALLREKESTVAIMKTVGATSAFITSQFLTVLCVLGLFGTLAGLALGSLLQYYLPALFAQIIPQGVKPTFSLRIFIEGFVLGTLAVASFAFLPLYRLKYVKPSAIFKKESSAPQKALPYWLVAVMIAAAFLGMALWHLNDFRIGLLFVLCAIAFLSTAALITQILLFALKKARPGSLIFRQALRGLFRPRSATRSIIITLTASLSILFSIYLLEQNIDATFIRSYPPDLPNVFFLDIQPDQLEEFSRELGMKADYYPVVRGSIAEINGVAIDLEEERKRRGDNLARELNFTYRNHLLADEALIEGKSLFRSDWEGLQVSVLDTVTRMKPMRVGDVITFRIQGIPMEARVSSIRTREGELIQPFFYFVFHEEVLKDAPQTIFTALRIEKELIASLQNRIVSRFPNVSVIDVTQTLSALGGVMHKLSGITRFFTLFSMSAGVLILISSVFATRYARIQEAVYFKILGARKAFVLQVFTLESVFLGLISALLALLISQTGCWIISSKLLDISYKPFFGPSFILIAATVILVTTVAMLSSVSILRQKPVVFLREHTEE